MSCFLGRVPVAARNTSFDVFLFEVTMGGFISNQMSQTKLDKKREDLQHLVGDSLKIEISSFTNWGENIKYEQILSCRPTRLADVQVGNSSFHLLPSRYT